MTTARILERWDLEHLPKPDPKDSWFLDWALRSPHGASEHLTAGWHAYQSLRDLNISFDSAREYFGGLGGQALMIEEMFRPRRHLVSDISPRAANWLKHVSDRSFLVEQSDAYAPFNTTPADLVGLDFGDLTVWKTRSGQPHAKLLNRVFALEPKAVILTDVAGPHLHLHRDRYEILVGDCSDYPSYLEGFAAMVEERWGYSLVAGFYHRWSTVMALVPVGAAPCGNFYPTPATPVGLELR